MLDLLSVENLSVSFHDKKVLHNINASFKKNKITAIIGPSGCGKSTLLKTLNTLLGEDPEATIDGKISFNNENIDKIKKEKIRQKIGMVFQNPVPFPLSIYKNMEYGLKYYGIKKDERKSMIEEKLKVTGLYEEVKDTLNKSALKLSGGQQQRLCIARALSIEPDILLLDEPCSSLDVKNTKNIEDMLLVLKEQYTIIIVTHNLFQASRIADEIIFMLDGQVIEHDITKNIFNHPKDQRTKEYVMGIYG